MAQEINKHACSSINVCAGKKMCPMHETSALITINCVDIIESLTCQTFSCITHAPDYCLVPSVSHVVHKSPCITLLTSRMKIQTTPVHQMLSNCLQHCETSRSSESTTVKQCHRLVESEVGERVIPDGWMIYAAYASHVGLCQALCPWSTLSRASGLLTFLANTCLIKKHVQTRQNLWPTVKLWNYVFFKLSKHKLLCYFLLAQKCPNSIHILKVAEIVWKLLRSVCNTSMQPEADIIWRLKSKQWETGNLRRYGFPAIKVRNTPRKAKRSAL